MLITLILGRFLWFDNLWRGGLVFLTAREPSNPLYTGLSSTFDIETLFYTSELGLSR